MSYFNLEGIYNLDKADTRITGNLAITLDVDNKLYVDTLDTNAYLAQTKWKKKKLDTSIKYIYSTALYEMFYPFNIIDKNSFYEKAPDTDITNRAYDNTFTNSYSSRFRYFAPIYIDNPSRDQQINLPSHFLIFRLKDYDFSKFDFDTLRTTFLNPTVLENFELVKTIPFGENNNIYNLIQKSYGADLDWHFYNHTDNTPANPKKYVSISGNDIDLGKLNSVWQYNIKKDEFDNTDVLDKYKELGYVSANQFNFNFNFDVDDVDANASEFIGFYVTKEFIENFNIDVNSYTNTFGLKITEKIKSLNPEIFILNDINGIKLNTIEQYDNQYTAGADYFYSTVDKNNTLRKLKLADNNQLYFYNKSLNLSNFIDVVQEHNTQLHATYLKNKFYTNIKLTLSNNQTTLRRNIFENGDWFSIKPNILLNYEFRIVANTSECCSSRTICKTEYPSVRFASDDITFTKIIYTEYPGFGLDPDIYENTSYAKETVITDIVFDKLYVFEEGQDITLSCSEFNNIKFKIERVAYDTINNKTTITVVDMLGQLFTNTSNILLIEALYRQTPHKLIYFNPEGTPTQVAKNISDAFNKFDSNMFEVIPIDNDIIIKAIHSDEAFKGFTFSYDFTKSNTLLNNLQLNGFDAVGYNLSEFYDTNNIIFNRKRNNIKLFHDFKPQKARVVLSKTDNMTDTDLLITKNGISKLNQIIIENKTTLTSNYIDDPIVENGIITGYNNINLYDVYELENSPDDDEFLLTGSSMVNKTTRFQPEINKYTVTETYSE